MPESEPSAPLPERMYFVTVASCGLTDEANEALFDRVADAVHSEDEQVACFGGREDWSTRATDAEETALVMERQGRQERAGRLRAETERDQARAQLAKVREVLADLHFHSRIGGGALSKLRAALDSVGATEDEAERDCPHSALHETPVTCPAACCSTVGHHPRCFQVVGVPADLPQDLCDCRTLRMLGVPPTFSPEARS